MSTSEGIVILGVPRSGTTFLRRLVDAHPRIHCPPETNLLNAVSRFLHEEQATLGITLGVLPGLAFSGYSEEDVFARLRAIVAGFHEEMASRAKKPRWCEKTAIDVFHLDAIERVFASSCRFICMFRHGLDVVCSMRDLVEAADRHLVEIHNYVRIYSSPTEAYAHAWADASHQLKRFAERNASRSLTLRYEDLVADPVAELERIFAFLDERTDVNQLLERAFTSGSIGLGDWKTYATKGAEHTSIDRWKTLPADVVARLAPIVNPLMIELGYEEIEVPRVDSADMARRKYRATQLVRQRNIAAS